MADQQEQQDVVAAARMLKPSEVAEIFGVTGDTVRVWLNDGTLKGQKIGKGKYWRIPISNVMELANKRHGDHDD